MSIPRLFQETSIFKPSAINDFVTTEITAAKATIKVTTDAIIARVTQAESAISSHSSRLTSAESSITQNASSIALKANSSDVYTKTQSDGLISTEVTNRNAAISTAVDNLTLSVSNTYATKNELSTEEGKRKASWAACSTATGTQAKVATCANFELYGGALVSVLFQNTNTHATPTLNVNSTGAKSIRSQTGQALSEGEYKWPAGCVRTFVYDGTYWRLSDDGTLFRVTQAEASISVNADNIASKVSTTDYNGETVASLINQSASTVKISASHVEIDGTATFSAIKSSADAAYDAKGAASTAESNAKAAIPTKVSQLSNDSGYQTSGQVSTAISTNAASKADALKRSQRIYRRETSTATLSGPTTWLSTSGTGYGNWSTKVPPLTSGTTKYPYLYTCIQTQTVSQSANNGTTCTCSSVLLDDTATVIDGGSIITGSVAANAISATSGTFDTANIPNLSAAKITSGDISAARIKANVISAINSLTAGTIDAARINAANLTIGYSQISGTPTIPSKTSQLTNDSSFGTTSQIATAKTEAINSANSSTDSKLESYSTTTQVNSAISTAKSEAISSANSSIDTKLTSYATKSDAVKRTQRIYYQSSSTTAPSTPGTSSSNWVTDTTGAANKWTLKRMSYASATPYVWTCEQKETVSGTVSYTSVLLDDTTTVIDGGKIITGSVAANAISATSGTFNTANIPNLSAAKITSGDISADRIKANVITAINSLTAGTIDAARINASALSIGYSQISGTPTIPSKTSQLTNDSSFQTSSQVSSTVATAKSEAISAAASDATTKANSAATTATNYLTDADTTGLMVHPNGVANTGVKITDVVNIMRSGTSVAQYGSESRIGPAASSHVNIASNAIDFYGASGNDNLLKMSVEQGNYGNYGSIAFPLSGGGKIYSQNGQSYSLLNLTAHAGVSQPLLTAALQCYDNSNDSYTSIKLDGITSDIDLTGNVTIHGNLCFSPATSIFGSNIIGIYAGTTVATLSNGNWASLASKSTLESKLGSGVTNTNTIIIAQNGDCNAVGNYAFSGAITSDGAARGYVYPAISGSVRWNWIAIRFSN